MFDFLKSPKLFFFFSDRLTFTADNETALVTAEFSSQSKAVQILTN